jgi:hypothetical protein
VAGVFVCRKQLIRLAHMAWIFTSIRCAKDAISNSLRQKKSMRKYRLLPLLTILIALSACRVIGDIFKAGVWTGVILVVVVVGLIIFVLAKIFGGGK